MPSNGWRQGIDTKAGDAGEAASPNLSAGEATLGSTHHKSSASAQCCVQLNSQLRCFIQEIPLQIRFVCVQALIVRIRPAQQQ